MDWDYVFRYHKKNSSSILLVGKEYITIIMLLQERNYNLYHEDDEIGDEVKHRVMSSFVGVTGHSSNGKSSRDSFSGKLRRSTFDLSSFNSLATSCSDSSSYSLPSPTRKSSTMRYRGQSSSSTSSAPEGAASEALMRLVASQDPRSTLQEVHGETTETQGESDHCIRETPSAATACTNTSSIEAFIQYFLEVILFGCLIVPFLELTIAMERYIRSAFGELHRNLGCAFSSLSAPSSSIEEEPIHFERRGLYPSPNSREDFYGTSEAVYSSSSDDNSEEDEDGWGHFADFRDELADEASFIPSCSVMPLRPRTVAAVAAPPSCVNTLETLAEGREEDDEAEEDWSF